MNVRRAWLPLVVMMVMVAAVRAQTPAGSQQPARDNPTGQAPQPSGAIKGRVLTADTGRPVKRARVAVSAAELQGSRATLTDDAGAFEFTELPAGRYTLSVSKQGFIALSYGQRRPLQAGTPLQLADNQRMEGIEFRLPRGGVISGRVVDEDGDGLPGASIRVARYQYLQGERRLTPVGAAMSDDRGQYRIWGLMPGDYYISATARGAANGFFFSRGNFAGPRGGAIVVAPIPPDEEEQFGYAPTYYPGVTSVNDARPVTVGVSQEVLDIDFGVQLVRTARLSGRVINNDGSPASTGNVRLTPEAAASRGQLAGSNYAARIDWDGAFAVANIPPGRYILRARGDDQESPQYATMLISMNGADVSGVNVVLTSSATISGTVLFPGQGSTGPGDVTAVRVTAPPSDASTFGGPQPTARVEKDGRFTLDGIPTGPHMIRANNVPRGWMLKSVLVSGRDVIDSGVDIRSGQRLTDVTLVFTNNLGQLSGTVATDGGTPMSDYTVLVFPTDESLWHPQSRQIMTTRPDQNGRYTLRGLPPGEYYVAAVDPPEAGEWFEPAFLDQQRPRALRITLSEGDSKTRDLKVPTP